MILFRLLSSYLSRAIIAYILLALACYALTYAQPPWQTPSAIPPPAPARPALAAGGGGVKPKIIRDTVTVRDTVKQIDTLYIAPPKKLRYKYKLQICNLDYNRIISTKINLYDYKFKSILDNLNNEEKAKNCYFSSAYSDSNYTYSYGVENIRTNGYIYDNYGNKLEQTEKILTGITLVVKGDKVTFDYLENKKLMLYNSFNDDEVNFYADYTLFERRCNFWVFCNYAEKKQYIFLNLTREEM
jgi:hypothetical protein